MPGSLTDLLNNDLRIIAQQFASTAYHCRMIEKKLDQRNRETIQDRKAMNDVHEKQLKDMRHKLQSGQDRIQKLELALDDVEVSFSTADKRRKLELEKKTEKINNQKRRIKEQQDQIDVSLPLGLPLASIRGHD